MRRPSKRRPRRIRAEAPTSTTESGTSAARTRDSTRHDSRATRRWSFARHRRPGPLKTSLPCVSESRRRCMSSCKRSARGCGRPGGRTATTAEITEAWQESGRDYATAYIDGSIVDYTVDEVTHRLVDGSRTAPKDIEEFWTFTRPAGLNFWMLSAIRTA